MNIDKAIRKQKKSYKRFMLSMCFIFFTLPIALVIYKKFYIFYIAYLAITELLILLAIVIKASKEALNFNYNGYRLKIILGIQKKTINIVCKKVALVHVESISFKGDDKKDFKIIILSTSAFRSDRMLHVNENFLKNHPYVSHQYNRLKVLNPENEYFYTVVKRGGAKKYLLLDVIYKSCVYANFTEEAVEEIKFYRENSENY